MDETSTLQIEAKLVTQRTNIQILEQNLEKYNNLTKSASSILKNFESRLLKVILDNSFRTAANYSINRSSKTYFLSIRRQNHWNVSKKIWTLR
jgi:hypothetical protein